MDHLNDVSIEIDNALDDIVIKINEENLIALANALSSANFQSACIKSGNFDLIFEKSCVKNLDHASFKGNIIKLKLGINDLRNLVDKLIKLTTSLDDADVPDHFHTDYIWTENEHGKTDIIFQRKNQFFN